MNGTEREEIFQGGSSSTPRSECGLLCEVRIMAITRPKCAVKQFAAKTARAVANAMHRPAYWAKLRREEGERESTELSYPNSRCGERLSTL